MIGPALLAAVDLTFDVLEAGAHAVVRFKALRAASTAPLVAGLPYSAVEHQRAQARAGASHGTVIGPVRSSRGLQ